MPTLLLQQFIYQYVINYNLNTFVNNCFVFHIFLGLEFDIFGSIFRFRNNAKMGTWLQAHLRIICVHFPVLHNISFSKCKSVYVLRKVFGCVLLGKPLLYLSCYLNKKQVLCSMVWRAMLSTSLDWNPKYNLQLMRFKRLGKYLIDIVL